MDISIKVQSVYGDLLKDEGVLKMYVDRHRKINKWRNRLNNAVGALMMIGKGPVSGDEIRKLKHERDLSHDKLEALSGHLN